MANTHEYVIFDRARLDPVLSMRWSELDRAYPGWGQWESARDFLVEWALDDESQIKSVDQILARKTVRTTLSMCDSPFHFLWGILYSKGLTAASVDIANDDYDYGDDIAACAGAAFVKGDISLATLAAVYHLHANRVDPARILPSKVTNVIKNQPSPPMFPGFYDMMPVGGNEIGVSQSRRFITFILRAWHENWPIRIMGQKDWRGTSIRSCTVAGQLGRVFRRISISKPCIFRWYEC